MKAKQATKEEQALSLSMICIKNALSFLLTTGVRLLQSVWVYFIYLLLDLSLQTSTCSRTPDPNGDVQGITALTWAPVNAHVPRCLLELLQFSQEV